MTSLQQKDTTYTKIFVGGLPYHTTDDTLQRFFDPYGDIEEAVVITDRQTGKSRGYGFVTMRDRAAAERACKEPNPIIDGRKANVNLAYLGAKPRIPVGELIAFPYGLKSGLPSYIGGEIMGLPQILYPSTYLPSTHAAGLTIAHQPHHLLPATAVLPGGQIIDYTAMAAAYSTATAVAPLTSLDSSAIAAFPYNLTTGAYIGSPSGAAVGNVCSSAAHAGATYLPFATTTQLPAHQTVLGPHQFSSVIPQQFHPQHIHNKLMQ